MNSVLSNHIRNSSGMLVEAPAATPQQAANGPVPIPGFNAQLVLQQSEETLGLPQQAPFQHAALPPPLPSSGLGASRGTRPHRGKFALNRCLYIPGLKHMLDNLQGDMLAKLSWYPTFVAPGPDFSLHVLTSIGTTGCRGCGAISVLRVMALIASMIHLTHFKPSILMQSLFLLLIASTSAQQGILLSRCSTEFTEPSLHPVIATR